MKPSLNLLTLAGLMLILSLVTLGIIFGLKNNQGIESLVSQDLSQALDQSRQSMNEKEIYIQQLINQIKELEQELIRVRTQNPELTQFEEQMERISKLDEQVSKLEEQISILREENIENSLRYSKALDEKNDEITQLKEKISESNNVLKEESDAVLRAIEENTDLQSRIDEQNAEIAQLRKDLSESYTLDEQESDAVLRAIEENTDLQSRIDEQNAEIAQLNKLLDQACDCEPVESVVNEVKYIKKVEPIYEINPNETPKVGKCSATFNISETGKAENIEIECTDPLFNNLVLVSVQKSIFQPKTINGIPQTDLRHKARFSFK